MDALKAANRNLTVFNNVVASRPYTIEVLQQVLTFADQEHPDRFLTDPSLMNLMKQAGYKTFWITNQQTMTKRNTMLTTFAQQTDAQFYLNNQRSQNASQLDGAVLAPFAKVLDDPAPKKFIVVHLLGTHMNYKYRYPADYARFVDRQGAPAALSDDQVEVYNSYDNAVLYNDYVVSSLIKGFANSDPNGFLVYLSTMARKSSTKPRTTVSAATKATRPAACTPCPSWSGLRPAGSRPIRATCRPWSTDATAAKT